MRLATFSEKQHTNNYIDGQVCGNTDLVDPGHVGYVKIGACLEDQGDLCDGDHNENDCLCTEPFDFIVHEEQVTLSIRRGSDDGHKEESDDIDIVGGGDVEEQFEHKRIEIVENRYPQNQLYLEVSLESFRGFPFNSVPFGRGELKDDSLRLSDHGSGFKNASPLVFPKLEITTQPEANLDSQTVTEEDVKNPLIPPALSEVGYHVYQDEFDELPGNREDPKEKSVSEIERFYKPAEEMCKNKYVEFLCHVLPRKRAVLGVQWKLERDANRGIDGVEDRPCLRWRGNQQHYQNQEIQEGAPK